jgi:hypothetical protein
LTTNGGLLAGRSNQLTQKMATAAPDSSDAWKHLALVLADSSQLLVLFIIHILKSIFLFGYLSYFVYFEYRKHQGFREMIQNRYIVITIAVNICTLIDSVLYVAFFWLKHQGFVLDSNMDIAHQSLLHFVSSVFITASAAGHIILLYLRTSGVLKTKKCLGTLFSVLGYICIFFGSSGVICSALLLMKGEDDPAKWTVTRIIFTVSVCVFSACLAIIDFISTMQFRQYVKDVEKHLNAQKFMDNSQEKTVRIARSAMHIAAVSLFGVIFFIASRFVYSDLLGEWIYLLTDIPLGLVGALWMQMKIKIDQLSKQKPTPAVSATSNGNRPQAGIRSPSPSEESSVSPSNTSN